VLSNLSVGNCFFLNEIYPQKSVLKKVPMEQQPSFFAVKGHVWRMNGRRNPRLPCMSREAHHTGGFASRAAPDLTVPAGSCVPVSSGRHGHPSSSSLVRPAASSLSGRRPPAMCGLWAHARACGCTALGQIRRSAPRPGAPADNVVSGGVAFPSPFFKTFYC
jgi:hypothetical protein